MEIMDERETALMNEYYQLLDTIDDVKLNFGKYFNRNNKQAGKRFGKALLKTRKTCIQLRKLIVEVYNFREGERKNALLLKNGSADS